MVESDVKYGGIISMGNEREREREREGGRERENVCECKRLAAKKNSPT